MFSWLWNREDPKTKQFCADEFPKLFAPFMSSFVDFGFNGSCTAQPAPQDADPNKVSALHSALCMTTMDVIDNGMTA